MYFGYGLALLVYNIYWTAIQQCVVTISTNHTSWIHKSPITWKVVQFGFQIQLNKGLLYIYLSILVTCAYIFGFLFMYSLEFPYFKMHWRRQVSWNDLNWFKIGDTTFHEVLPFNGISFLTSGRFETYSKTCFKCDYKLNLIIANC